MGKGCAVMAKKCEKCPMINEDSCKCIHCSYEPLSSEGNDKESKPKADKPKNLFIENGVKRRIGLIKDFSLVSDYELKRIIFEARREQNRRSRNLQMRAAKKRSNKNEKNENGN